MWSRKCWSRRAGRSSRRSSRHAGGALDPRGLARPAAGHGLPRLAARPLVRRVPPAVRALAASCRSTWSTRTSRARPAINSSARCPAARADHGLIPRPADRADSGWDGYVPFDGDALPGEPGRRVFSRRRTIPSPAARSSGPITATTIASAPSRMRSRSGEKWSVEQCLALQTDVRSVPWEEIRDIVLALAPVGCRQLAKGSNSCARGTAASMRIRPPRASSSSSSPRCAVRVAKAKAPRMAHRCSARYGLGGTGQQPLLPIAESAISSRLIREQPAGLVRVVAGGTGVGPGCGRAETPSRSWAGPGVLGLGPLAATAARPSALRKHRWLGPAFNLGPVPCGGDCNTVSQAGARPAEPDRLHAQHVQHANGLRPLRSVEEPLRPLRRSKWQSVVRPPRGPASALAIRRVDRDSVGAGRSDPGGSRDAAATSCLGDK